MWIVSKSLCRTFITTELLFTSYALAERNVMSTEPWLISVLCVFIQLLHWLVGSWLIIEFVLNNRKIEKMVIWSLKYCTLHQCVLFQQCLFVTLSQIICFWVMTSASLLRLAWRGETMQRFMKKAKMNSQKGISRDFVLLSCPFTKLVTLYLLRITHKWYTLLTVL